MAGEGKANHEIGEEVNIVRTRVLRWRRRFEEQGIRGLWDVESIPPRQRIPEAVEQAIVFDCLYRFRLSVWVDDDISLGWTARGMSLRHGVSPASVQRVWKKYGIVMQRLRHSDLGVDLKQLKISQDPLFGLTVYELAGLFYESVGPAVVFCASARPFAELSFSSLDAAAKKKMLAGVVAEFRKLDKRRFGRPDPAEDKMIEFLKAIQAEPRHAGAQIHLLVERPEKGAPATVAVQAFLATQKCIHVHYTPWTFKGKQWAELVDRWLAVISEWPLQSSFVDSVNNMSQLLQRLPSAGFLDTLIIY